MPSKRVTEKDIVVSATVPNRHKPATTKRVKRTAPAPVAAAEVSATEPVIELVKETPSQQQQIAALAYSYWVARGYQGGSPEQDWLRAEQEVLAASAIA